MFAEVLAIVWEILFDNHLYIFGWKTLRQKSGGATSLRATCAIASLIMCSWDRAWTKKMEEVRIRINKYVMYMDDGHSFMAPV